MRYRDRSQVISSSACLAILAALVVAISFDASLTAQTPEAGTGKFEFEVASVKPSANTTDGGALVQAVPGRLNIRNFTPRTLIQFAYDVAYYQVSGGPAWITSAHYDIQAKAEGNPSSRQMSGPMLQALLADRFGLAFHRETRQMNVYALTAPKGTAKLHRTANGSCVLYSMDAPPPTLPQPGSAQPNFCGFPKTLRSGLNRTLDGKAITLSQLATSLSREQLRRPVIDKTGSDEKFDIHLTWMADSSNDEPGSPDGSSIFTALQEQLDLKLESTRGPVEVLVIDRLERPSEN